VEEVQAHSEKHSWLVSFFDICHSFCDSVTGISVSLFCHSDRPADTVHLSQNLIALMINILKSARKKFVNKLNKKGYLCRTKR
jgi:hypothetical protein